MDSDIEQLIRYLVDHLECSACHHHYHAGDFEVLDRGSTLLLLLMTCHHCQVQGLMVALLREHRIEPSRKAAETDEPGAADPITVDDVLDCHCFLESFQGDCVALLKGQE